MLEVLVKALKPDRDARYRDGVDYLYAVHDLLSSIDAEGPPLVELVARFRGISSRDQLEVTKGTGHFSPDEIAEMTADLDAVDAAEVGPPGRPRGAAPEEAAEDEAEEEAQPKWGKVARGAAEAATWGQPFKNQTIFLKG